MKRMIVDAGAAARALVVLAWALFFTWLWASGQMTRYLGPRTYWVVPVGAGVLAVVAAGHVLAVVRGGRGGGGRGLAVGEAVGLALMLAPIVAVIAVPSPRLGALAASKKSSGQPTLGSIAASVPDPSGTISFIDIEFASRSSEYAAQAGISEGSKVDLLGFVSDTKAPGGGIEVTRFYVSCCAADAIPHSAVVAGPAEPRLTTDDWVRVSGELHQQGGRWVVSASKLTPTREPKDPYLY